MRNTEIESKSGPGDVVEVQIRVLVDFERFCTGERTFHNRGGGGRQRRARKRMMQFFSGCPRFSNAVNQFSKSLVHKKTPNSVSAKSDLHQHRQSVDVNFEVLVRSRRETKVRYSTGSKPTCGAQKLSKKVALETSWRHRNFDVDTQHSSPRS